MNKPKIYEIDTKHLNKYSSLGAVDPQLGSIFRFGSAYTWDKIIKFKGKKAEDQSVSFSIMGKQYTKTIKKYLDETINFPTMSKQQKKDFINLLTSGEIEHGFPITYEALLSYGVPVKPLNNEINKKLIQLVSSSALDGVYFK